VSTEKALYFVAVKALLRRGADLLITHDVFGDWDLPGGRLRPADFGASLEQVLCRKLVEELGPEVSYRLDAPVVFFRHQRVEATAIGPSASIFAIGFEATYLGGDILLGEHHDAFEWVAVQDFDVRAYFGGGWRRGLEHYQSLLRSGDNSPRDPVDWPFEPRSDSGGSPSE
jgi:8-oxo-dGTP pyrophosphatase MutT (NUDIX family)